MLLNSAILTVFQGGGGGGRRNKAQMAAGRAMQTLGLQNRAGGARKRFKEGARVSIAARAKALQTIGRQKGPLRGVPGGARAAGRAGAKAGRAAAIIRGGAKKVK